MKGLKVARENFVKVVSRQLTTSMVSHFLFQHTTNYRSKPPPYTTLYVQSTDTTAVTVWIVFPQNLSESTLSQ